MPTRPQAKGISTTRRPSHLGGGAALGRLPGGQADEQGRGRPAGVQQRALDVGALGGLDQVDHVAQRVEREAHPEHDPGPAGPPAREAEDRDDHAEQDRVAERVGQVGEHRGHVARGGADDRLVGHGEGDRRHRHRADHAVEPEARADACEARAHQQHEHHVAGRVPGQPERVGDARVGRVGIVGVDDGPDDVRRGPAHDAGAHQGPGQALLAHGGRAPQAEGGAGEEQPVVEVVLEGGRHLARPPGRCSPAGRKAPSDQRRRSRTAQKGALGPWHHHCRLRSALWAGNMSFSGI